MNFYSLIGMKGVSKMENHVATCDRETRKKPSKRKKRIFTIPYNPIGTIVEVQGGEIRKIRLEAGLVNQKEFAEACGWSRHDRASLRKQAGMRCPWKLSVK